MASDQCTHANAHTGLLTPWAAATAAGDATVLCASAFLLCHAVRAAQQQQQLEQQQLQQQAAGYIDYVRSLHLDG